MDHHGEDDWRHVNASAGGAGGAGGVEACEGVGGDDVGVCGGVEYFVAATRFWNDDVDYVEEMLGGEADFEMWVPT